MSVIERVSFEVVHDGYTETEYSDVPSTYSYAESISGIKLDRRRNYAIIDGIVCESAAWTRICSGCHGGGCSECGGRGKRREEMWLPLIPKIQETPL